jgi:hypothetical protein
MKETGIQDCESVQAALPEIVLGSLGADEAHRLLKHVATCANCHDMLQRDADLIAHSLSMQRFPQRSNFSSWTEFGASLSSLPACDWSGMVY